MFSEIDACQFFNIFVVFVNLLSFFQIAIDLFCTMLELRDLGHPDYLERSEQLQCNTDIKIAKDQVFLMNKLLYKII